MEQPRLKKVFFISECLVNQNIRAYGVRNIKGSGPITELLTLLTSYNCGITVVPCPEIPYEGLKRTACGREHYDNQIYRAQCARLAQDIITRYKLYLDDGYTVGGFICVNGSPSCAADFCSSNNGTKCNVPGIFIEELQKRLNQEGLSLRFIGVRVNDLTNVLATLVSIITNT